MKNYLFFALFFLSSSLNAQKQTTEQQQSFTAPDEIVSEGIAPQDHACLGSQLQPAIIAAAKNQLEIFKQEGKMLPQFKSISGLEWPLRANPSYDACNYYSLFQYFDHDPANPGSIADYNCGTITYDVPGYNHDGTDIGLYPYGRTMQADENVEVIAAAGGIILQKEDGNFDQNCDASNLDWNFLLIQHSDGTRTLYGHMKDGSLTSLQVGDMIATGDYIGIVGSSGASSGPHLHFAVLDQNFVSIDPFAGTCNNTSSSSLWASQKPYFDQHLNRVMTHSAAPSNGTCPALEDINEQTFFEPESTIYFSAHIVHARVNDSYTMTIRQPDGSVWNTFTNSPSQFFTGYSFFVFYTIPASLPTGQWTMECTTSFGESCSTTFTIEDCAQDLNFSNLSIPVGVSLVEEEAANSITSNVTIENGVEVSYDAGNRIDLEEGFHAKNGSTFEAFIDGCGGL